MRELQQHRYEDGPTTCRPVTAVLKNIRKEIKAARALSAADVRLAGHMGLVAVDVSRRIGYNDGTFYPPDDSPLARAPATHPLRAARLPRAAPAQQRVMHALALLVDFSDNVGTRPAADFRKMLFDATNKESLTNIYQELSYGKLTVTGEVIGYLRMPKPYSFYTNGESGTGNNYPNNTPGLLFDALTAFCRTDSLQRFDTDGDGYVDGIFLIHAGGGAEAEADPANRKDMIWSHKWTLPMPFVDHGVRVYAYSTEPEDGKVGVFAHEFGHVLGLPDVYDTSYRSEGVGNWCLMGGGSWGGGGAKPTRMSCWCLSKLGWIKPVKAKTGSYTLGTLEQSAKDCLSVWTGGNPGPEYFMVENRQKTGRDGALPGSGVAIWHIDENQSDNTNPLAYKVGLLQADGLRQLEQGKNSGDAGDLYRGTAGSNRADDSSNPSTRAHNGLKSKVAIGVAFSGANATVKIKV